MKKMRLMSLALMAALAMAPAITMMAQQKGVYTQDYSNDPKLVKAAQKWYKKGKWRNGFKKADAHSSVNLVDFYLQYQKNPEQWKALFDFIAKTCSPFLAASTQFQVPTSPSVWKTARTTRWRNVAAKAITITSISSMW